jgi:archaellin
VAVHIYTQALHRTTQITTEQHKSNIRTTQIQTNAVECGPCPVFASFTLAFALQLRKKQGKTSVRVRKTSVRLRETSVTVQYTYYQNTHTLQSPHKHTYYGREGRRNLRNRWTRRIAHKGDKGTFRGLVENVKASDQF